MQWLDIERPASKRISRQAATRVLAQAIKRGEGSPALYERLGIALEAEGRDREAVEAFETSLAAARDRFTAWGTLALTHIKLGDFARALAISEQGGENDALLARVRGEALEASGRTREAIDSYRRSFRLDPVRDFVAESIFRCLSRLPDPAELLAFSEELPDDHYFRSQRLAYRAVALSRLGRGDEARALIDVERHVRIYRFAPPAGLGDGATYNRALAEWLTANMGATPTPRPTCVIDYELRFTRHPLLEPLRDFFRASFADYVAHLPEMGLDRLLPVPQASELHEFLVFLRGRGRNGEHIHPGSSVIGVYYVQMPDLGPEAGVRGHLALGACTRQTRHDPAWGVRHVPAEPGTLVLFPAHMFHDVEPTRSTRARIAISADMRPVG